MGGRWRAKGEHGGTKRKNSQTKNGMLILILIVPLPFPILLLQLLLPELAALIRMIIIRQQGLIQTC